MAEKLNCWEHFRCGREQYPHDLSFDVCPAARSKALDGINGGVNGGRSCWMVFGTFCDEQGAELTEGRLTCEICSFFKLVESEEGPILVKSLNRAKQAVH